MASRNRVIYPAVNGQGVPNILSEAGIDPTEGVGLGFLEVIRPKCEAYLRAGNNPNAEEEIAGLRVFGVEHLRVAGPDVLTEAEALAERLAAAEAKLSQLNGLFHPDGTPVSDLVERLRRIAGR